MPDGFTVHPKLVKQLERRREALRAATAPTDGSATIDWAHAEALAFASLLAEGTPIRLTGQDTERGTFSQRHLVLHDAKTGQTFCPIQQPARRAGPVRAPQQPAVGARLRRASSTATRQEAPETLVLWEAQFGDFVNAAAGDRRPVHRLRPGQVGPDLAPDAAAPARLRGLRSRALLGAPRALPRARRRGQHPRRQPDDARAVLPPAAPSGADRQAAPADRDDAEVAAAPAAGGEPARRPRRGPRFEPVLAEPGVDDAQVTRLVLCTGKIYYDLVGHPTAQGHTRRRGRRASSCSTRSPKASCSS